MRVDGANALYEVLGRFVEELQRRDIPLSIENPTNSLLWNLLYFHFAIIHGDWVHCHACAFGSSRKKLTTFFVSSYKLFRSLERFCPGDQEYETWGFDENTAIFNTAKEAEYPDGMCTTNAGIVQTIFEAGLQPDDSQQSLLPQLRKHRNVGDASHSWCHRLRLHSCWM